MAKNPAPPRPVWQHPLVFPAVLAALAVLFLLSGNGGLAFAFVLGAIGAAMYMMGKARRWKGAPEAGLLVCAAGVVMALLVLFN